MQARALHAHREGAEVRVPERAGLRSPGAGREDLRAPLREQARVAPDARVALRRARLHQEQRAARGLPEPQRHRLCVLRPKFAQAVGGRDKVRRRDGRLAHVPRDPLHAAALLLRGKALGQGDHPGLPLQQARLRKRREGLAHGPEGAAAAAADVGERLRAGQAGLPRDLQRARYRRIGRRHAEGRIGAHLLLAARKARAVRRPPALPIPAGEVERRGAHGLRRAALQFALHGALQDPGHLHVGFPSALFCVQYTPSAAGMGRSFLQKWHKARGLCAYSLWNTGCARNHFARRPFHESGPATAHTQRLE